MEALNVISEFNQKVLLKNCGIAIYMYICIVFFQLSAFLNKFNYRNIVRYVNLRKMHVPCFYCMSYHKFQDSSSSKSL